MNAPVGSLSPRHHHRKFRSPIICYRRQRYNTPGTPLLSWKFDERQRAYGGVQVSARKLAAGLWQLRLLAEPKAYDCGVKCESCDRFRFQPRSGHVKIAVSSPCTSRRYGVEIKNLLGSPLLGYSSSLEIPHKQGSSLPYPKLVMEEVRKWDPGCSKTLTKACLYNHVKLLEDQLTTFSVVSALQAELVQARLKIHELEDEHRSSKKKFENLIRKLREERNSLYIRKCHKMQAIIDDLKDELSKERKIRKQIDFLNSKFVEELAKAESSGKKFMLDYEREKRARVSVEEVCNELAKRIGEDKAELEMMKRETARIREEVEEESNMMQLAEIWREERVQMKLVDAKLALEHKYSQMNKLVEELELFLMSSAATLDVMALRKSELIRQAVESVNIQASEEFEYVPPESDSILSIFEELRQGADDREMEVACSLNSISLASRSLVMYDGNAGQHFPNTDPRQKACNVSQLRPADGDGRVPNGTISGFGTVRKPVDDLGNPHITRGMKGSIEWPRVTRKTNLKGKLLKAMMENQKTHLRKVLK